MKNLTKQSQKTLNRLKLKSEDSKNRFPSLKSIHLLLTELEIEHKFDGNYSCAKQTKPSGYNYYTGGGNREYNGSKLSIVSEEKNIYINSTESYYSYNTYFYSRDLYRLIQLKLNK
tara:strand:+ start:170 stop:517 length:348 start_codon:yes stop_codon:yes gene_type:complete